MILCLSLIKNLENSKTLLVFRHYNITLFISTQYITQVAPLVRQQTNYAFIYHHDQKKSIEVLYENFGAGFETLKEFQDFLNNVTCIYIPMFGLYKR
jgi:hypothetical protein